MARNRGKKYTTHQMRRMMRLYKEQFQHVLMIKDQGMIKKVKQLAEMSETDPETWVWEVLEWYIVDHRSGKNINDPTKYADREEYDDDYNLDKELIEV